MHNVKYVQADPDDEIDSNFGDEDQGMLEEDEEEEEEEEDEVVILGDKGVVKKNERTNKPCVGSAPLQQLSTALSANTAASSSSSRPSRINKVAPPSRKSVESSMGEQLSPTDGVTSAFPSVSQTGPGRHPKIRATSPPLEMATAGPPGRNDDKDGSSSGSGQKRQRSGGSASSRSRSRAPPNIASLPWSLISALPPDDSSILELRTKGGLERTWRIKGVVTDLAGFKLKKKFSELRVYVEDGGGSGDHKRMMFLADHLVKTIFGDRDTADLLQMKKSQQAAFDSLLAQVAMYFRSCEGIMKVRLEESRQDKGKLLPCILDICEPSTGDTSSSRNNDLEAILNFGEGALQTMRAASHRGDMG